MNPTVFFHTTESAGPNISQHCRSERSASHGGGGVFVGFSESFRDLLGFSRDYARGLPFLEFLEFKSFKSLGSSA